MRSCSKVMMKKGADPEIQIWPQGPITNYAFNFKTDGATKLSVDKDFAWASDGDPVWRTQGAGTWNVPRADKFYIRIPTGLATKVRFGETPADAWHYVGKIEIIDLTASDVQYMFKDAKVTEIDTSGLKAPGLQWCSGVFYACANLINPPDVSMLVDALKIDYLFGHCSNLVSAPDLTALTKITSITASFNQCFKMKTAPDFSNAHGIQSVMSTFGRCNELEETPKFSASGMNLWEGIQGMFSDCYKLPAAPDMSNWGTRNLRAADAFSDCKLITHVGPISFRTQEDSTRMFSGCTNLVCIHGIDNAGGGARGNGDMFKDCPNLVAPDAAMQNNLSDGEGAVYTNPNPCP
jgi:hypothetical protein